jgi:hypothetical protein
MHSDYAGSMHTSMILSNCSPAGAVRRCRGLAYVRGYARQLLREGGALAPDGVKKMAAFDHALIARHLSSGGTADLLGLTWFLAQFPKSDADFPRIVLQAGSSTQIAIAIDWFLDPTTPAGELNGRDWRSPRWHLC